MAKYKCFECGHEAKSEELEKRFVCSECGSRIFYKPRSKMKTLQTD